MPRLPFPKFSLLRAPFPKELFPRGLLPGSLVLFPRLPTLPRLPGVTGLVPPGRWNVAFPVLGRLLDPIGLLPAAPFLDGNPCGNPPPAGDPWEILGRVPLDMPPPLGILGCGRVMAGPPP